MRPAIRHAFTLVEILIVVLILGILAALVVPQFASATSEATAAASRDQLQSVRRAMSVYYVRNNNAFPNVTAGVGTWGELVAPGYLKEAPVNAWVGAASSKIVAIGTGPDPGYQTTHGWVYDPATGEIWAGAFDVNDDPYPRP